MCCCITGLGLVCKGGEYTATGTGESRRRKLTQISQRRVDFGVFFSHQGFENIADLNRPFTFHSKRPEGIAYFEGSDITCQFRVSKQFSRGHMHRRHQHHGGALAGL